jgi:enoyl-CoA hydratase/carnithine racemase
MHFETLRYIEQDRVGIVTFCTPHNLNALSEKRLEELEAVLGTAETSAGLGALVITGEGKAFCVGLDLALLERAFSDIPYFESIVRRMAALIARLEALPMPTIAAVNGYARAGGFEISMGCDFIVVAREAQIGDVHTDSGVLPACASLRLQRRVGAQAAKDILWTSRWLNGDEAVAIGLAARTFPLATLLDDTLAFAAQLTNKPRVVISSIKQLLHAGSDLDVAAGTEMELRNFIHYMQTQPHGIEGFTAFREGREPYWRATAVSA